MVEHHPRTADALRWSFLVLTSATPLYLLVTKKGEVFMYRKSITPKGETTTIQESLKGFEEIKQIRKAMIRQFEIQSARQKTCWERIYEIVTSKGTTTSGMFVQKTNLISKVYDRAKNNVKTMPKLKTIVTIAVAYDLDLSTTEELLRLAGHAFIPTSQEHDCYKFILTTMYGYTMQDKNDLLASEGFTSLGSTPKEKTEKDV